MKTNTIIIVVGTLALAGAGYWFFLSGSTVDPALTASGSGSDAQTQFQTLVNELSPISFDTSLFSSASFTSLVNIGTQVAPESSGRIDPFAQLH